MVVTGENRKRAAPQFALDECDEQIKVIVANSCDCGALAMMRKELYEKSLSGSPGGKAARRLDTDSYESRVGRATRLDYVRARAPIGRRTAGNRG